MKIYLHRRADYGMVNAEGKINFDEIFASLFVINVSILMYKKPPEIQIQYNTMHLFGTIRLLIFSKKSHLYIYFYLYFLHFFQIYYVSYLHMKQ